MFSSDDAINEATVLAIRDGGARIAIELIDQPAVQAWLQSIGEPSQPSAAPLASAERNKSPETIKSAESLKSAEGVESIEMPESVDGVPDA